MTDPEKLQSLKSQIKELEQKKSTLTDAAEIKAVNKQINALQVDFGRLKEKIKNERAYLKDVEREFIHLLAGDEWIPNPFVLESAESNIFAFFVHLLLKRRSQLRKMCVFAPKVGWKMCEIHIRLGMKMCIYFRAKETTLTATAEIKAVNKQINALQMD